MATIEGARALGLESVTGSLEAGKRADAVVVDLQKLHTTPLLRGAYANIAQHLVFSSNAADVRAVWVDGQLVVDEHRLVNDDEDVIRATAQSAAEELFERRRRVRRSEG
jgi:5-methylthioadenosine/S-adenosylhomocysteine deaminase